MQSPIALYRDFTYPNIYGKGELRTRYSNMDDATVKMKGYTVQINFKEAQSQDNYFESRYLSDNLKGPQKYNAAQFHFHAGSEHTIDGRRYDLEMHTVHLPPEGQETTSDPNKPDIFGSAVGLIFDVNDYDPCITDQERDIIDRFFESLNFQHTPPSVNSWDPDYKNGQDLDEHDHIILNKNTNIPYGDLMTMLDFENRWVYEGSLTTPPCTRRAIHQVVDRVLPIKKAHYDGYVDLQRTIMQKAVFNSNGDVTEVSEENYKNLAWTGNYREICEVDDHNVVYFRSQTPRKCDKKDEEG